MRRKPRDPGGPGRTSGTIENHQRGVRVPLPPLEKFLQRAKKEIGLPGDSVAVRLVNDAEMTRLNATYRGKKKSTDFLPSPGKAGPGNPGRPAQQVRKPRGNFLGAIATPPKAARRNSRSLGRTLPQELQVLILHGLLHLL